MVDWLRTRLGKQFNITVRPFKDTDAYGADPNRSFRYAELGDRYGSSASEDDDEIQPNQVALLKRMDVYDPGLPERLVLVHGDKTMTVIVHKQTPGKLDLRVLVGQVDTQGVFSSRVVSVNTGNEQASADATAELVAKAKEMIEEVIKSVASQKNSLTTDRSVLGLTCEMLKFRQRKMAQCFHIEPKLERC